MATSSGWTADRPRAAAVPSGRPAAGGTRRPARPARLDGGRLQPRRPHASPRRARDWIHVWDVDTGRLRRRVPSRPRGRLLAGRLARWPDPRDRDGPVSRRRGPPGRHRLPDARRSSCARRTSPLEYCHFHRTARSCSPASIAARRSSGMCGLRRMERRPATERPLVVERGITPHYPERVVPGVARGRVVARHEREHPQ